MFSKSIFIFGLLILLICQGTSASSTNEVTVQTFQTYFAKLIDQVKKGNDNLKMLVSRTITDALGTLGNFTGTVKELDKKFMNTGIAAITDRIEGVVDLIKNKTQVAFKFGISTGKCLTGHNKQLEQLGIGLVANLTNCVTTAGDSVVIVTNNDFNVIKQIVANVTAIPVQFSKCLSSFSVVRCVGNLLRYVTALLFSLPGQIIKNAINTLLDKLTGCVKNIITSTDSQTQAIIVEIKTCVHGETV